MAATAKQRPTGARKLRTIRVDGRRVTVYILPKTKPTAKKKR